uniref:DNA-directed RNA polymerase subunit n=1 Tax=Tetraselmis sp. CCMP 881 TaxID=1812852 RepID=A0A142BY34_9CHLO|nr:beta' subunit of RNA polymerase [Tetraselmis sp. CCMP 881]
MTKKEPKLKKKLTNSSNIFEVNEKTVIHDQKESQPTVFRRKNKTARIQITLQSPDEQLKQFARVLPNGSITGHVTNSRTLNYKNLKPDPGGLFCEKIFGPITTNVCACGKTRPNANVTYCVNCEVEYISSRARRYRIGFIELAMPMAHIWYLKGRPSYISILLGIKQKEAEKLVYGEYWVFRSFTLGFEKRIRHLRASFNEEAYYFSQRNYIAKKYSTYEKDPTKVKFYNEFYKTLMYTEKLWKEHDTTQEFFSSKVRRKRRMSEKIANQSPLDFWVHSPVYHQYPRPFESSDTNINLTPDKLNRNHNIITTSQINKTPYNAYRVYHNPKFKRSLGFTRKTYSWTKQAFLDSKSFYRAPFIRDSLIGYFDREAEYKREKITEKRIIHYLFPQPREFGVSAKVKYKAPLKNSMIFHENFQFHCLITGGDAFRHLFSKIDTFRMYSLLFFKLLYLKKKLRYVDRKLYRKFGGLYFNELLKFPKEERFAILPKEQIQDYKYKFNMVPKLARQLKLFKTFWLTGTRPEWMFISFLPIIPPDLRPILKLNANQLAVSDLNRLYQYVFLRNKNLKGVRFEIYKRALNLDFSIKNGIQVSKIDYECDFHSYKFTLSLLSFHTNQVQRALDGLFENNKGGSQAICGFNDRPLKSLSEILKGKTGRFRQNLLGKRVDYSGRSVIVVGPTLKLHQCGLPKEIALELFQPLLIRRMILLNLSKTIIGAKNLIHQDHPIVWHLLNEVMTNYPILLNRAPTLHRLGVQAFLPKLVRGKAILLHPLVCPAFNADFDGDQMGVHLPISLESKSEAWSLMLATQNILSPATGEPILVPSQDMVLGCYYSTTINLKTKFKYPGAIYFNNINDAYKTYLTNSLHPHTFIWLKWNENFESNQPQRKICEIRLKRYRKFFVESTFIAPNAHQTFEPKNSNQSPIILTGVLHSQYIKTTIGRILINKLFQDNIINFKRKYTNYFTRTKNTSIKIETQNPPTEYNIKVLPYYGYLLSNQIGKNLKPNQITLSH